MNEALEEGRFTQCEVNQLWEKVVGTEPKINDYPIRDIVRVANAALLKGTLQKLQASRPSSADHTVEITVRAMMELRAQRASGPNISDKEVYQKGLLVNFDPTFYNKYMEMRRFLTRHYIQSPRVERMDEKARQIVGSVFEKYRKKPTLMSWKTQQTYKEADCSPRVIADHIACMTDRYAMDLYRELFLP